MFERTLKIIDEDILNRMKSKKILLVGVGGVGGYALEALVRLGLSNITIVDSDTVDITNLNRQLITNEENIGESKVSVAKTRMCKINSKITIKGLAIFLDEHNINLLDNDYDYIIDACDTVATKVLLIKKALQDNSKIISSMGMGNRINPSNVVVTRLDKTYNDPLAKIMRTKLKSEDITLKIPVVWSSESPIKPKNGGLGSIVLVPASAGIHIAYYVLEDIMK